MTRDELISRIIAGRKVLLDVLEQIPAEKRDLAGAMGDWSVKDTIVHINYWGGQLVTLLYQVRNDLPVTTISADPKLDVEEMNQRWHAQGKDRDWEAAWSDFNGIHKQVLRRVNEFSDEELNAVDLNPKLRKRPLWDWIQSDTYDHDEEHAKALKEWVEKNT